MNQLQLDTPTVEAKDPAIVIVAVKAEAAAEVIAEATAEVTAEATVEATATPRATAIVTATATATPTPVPMLLRLVPKPSHRSTARSRLWRIRRRT